MQKKQKIFLRSAVNTSESKQFSHDDICSNKKRNNKFQQYNSF